jgi:hypothetical protein
MSELLLPPEHRYAKRIKEQLNEDGSELSILNLGPTHQLHGIFQNILLMDGEKFWKRNQPLVTFTELSRKLRKTVLLPNNTTWIE